MDKELLYNLNKSGDEALFAFATRKGHLGIFDIMKAVKFLIIIPFCTLTLAFGLLSLYIVYFRKIEAFTTIGIIAIIVSLGVPFLFFYEDRRILREATRRNMFISIAEKRWLISKFIYLAMIVCALAMSFAYIYTGSEFLEKGVITSNDKVIYDGRSIK